MCVTKQLYSNNRCLQINVDYSLTRSFFVDNHFLSNICWFERVMQLLYVVCFGRQAFTLCFAYTE